MSNSALQNMVDQIHQPTHTPVAIEAIDLVKDYGTGESLVHALKDVNVQFEQAGSRRLWDRPDPENRR